MEHVPTTTTSATVEPLPAEALPRTSDRGARIGSGIVGGLIGIGIAVVCLLPPIFHFVLGPLGPAIGGFVGGARVKARGREAAVVGLTIGIGCAAIATGAFIVFNTVSASNCGPDGMLCGVGRAPVALVAAVDTLVLLYASTLGWLGAWFGGRG